jgi:hypothetical protein
MSTESKRPKSTQGTKPSASDVVAEAIAAMRNDPVASGAADAIEEAWSGGELDVDQAARAIEGPSSEEEA